MVAVDGKKFLIITPTYNERDNIVPLVKSIVRQGVCADILFVDDNSQDGTRGEILKMQKEHPGRISLLPRPAKLGLGSAYVEGFSWGLRRGYEYLTEMDADLSHNPSYLDAFVKQLPEHQVVVGSRYAPGGGTENWSRIRKLISRGGSWYARSILGVGVQDLTGGYNMWHRNVLEKTGLHNLKSDGYVFQIELKFRALLAGFSLTEVPIIFCDRRAGQSKMSMKIVLEAVLRVVLLRLGKNRILQKILENPEGQPTPISPEKEHPI